MKVLIIGSGAREHCLAWKCKQSKLVSQVFVAKGNDGMKSLATTVNIEEADIQGLLDFAIENKIELTIVGTEVSLELGITDLFIQKGLKIFAPTKAASEIETSKDFAKKLMQRANIPTAEFKTFANYSDAKNYIENVGVPIVIKNNGLAAGKGVVVAFTMTEALDAINDFLNNKKFGTQKVVIEEYLEGEEFTLMCLVHKEKFIALPLSQDHKRAYENDIGPNTGGMGAYSPVKQISCFNEAIESVVKPLLHQMNLEGISFTGFLYAGLMQTNSGVKVIEFNARFGDPECEVLLPILEFDFVEIILSLFKNSINNKQLQINTKQKSLGVVIAAKNYPIRPVIGNSIDFPISNEVLVFHASTKLVDGKFVSNGGRVVVIVGIDRELNIAQKKVYNYINSMQLSDQFFYRTDIGNKSISILN